MPSALRGASTSTTPVLFCRRPGAARFRSAVPSHAGLVWFHWLPMPGCESHSSTQCQQINTEINQPLQAGEPLRMLLLYTCVQAPMAGTWGQCLPLGSGHQCGQLGTSSGAPRTGAGPLYPRHLRACLCPSGDSHGSEAGSDLQPEHRTGK